MACSTSDETLLNLHQHHMYILLPHIALHPINQNAAFQRPIMDHDMPGMTMAPPPPSHGDGHTMTHMTFFWGTDSEILFSGWPGTRTGMYVLALFFVFALAFIIELLSCYLHRGNEKTGGLVRTAVHGLRIGLAYLVMLALMSFNIGVFIVAVVGHALGFFVFGSRVFKRFSPHSDKPGYDNRVGC